jgi:hypothetical protein
MLKLKKVPKVPRVPRVPRVESNLINSTSLKLWAL